jgi:hypothetical protein
MQTLLFHERAPRARSPISRLLEQANRAPEGEWKPVPGSQRYDPLGRVVSQRERWRPARPVRLAPTPMRVLPRHARGRLTRASRAPRRAVRVAIARAATSTSPPSDGPPPSPSPRGIAPEAALTPTGPAPVTRGGRS